jgi:uncharacterized protein (TIGR02145 family)
MKKSIFLYIFIFISVSLNSQVINIKEKERNEGIQQNATYNLEEIKVRWKKAALENCPGVPCTVVPPPPSFTCGTSTISDLDGNSYNTVSIGTQCWTKENLKVTKYNDGTAIPNSATGGSVGTSRTWQDLTTGAYTIYANESSSDANATNYGFLYNWYAAVGIVTNLGSPTKNICPIGWRVPTDGEWTSLIQFIVPSETLGTSPGIQSSNAGGKLKSQGTAYWNSSNTGATNESGFSALPGGYRSNNGSFNSIRSNAFFWSASEDGSTLNYAWYRILFNNNSDVIRGSNITSLGASVRCLKD